MQRMPAPREGCPMNASALSRVLVVLFAVVAISACTRSLEMTYNPAGYQLPQANQLHSVALGIGKSKTSARGSIGRSARASRTSCSKGPGNSG